MTWNDLLDTLEAMKRAHPDRMDETAIFAVSGQLDIEGESDDYEPDGYEFDSYETYVIDNRGTTRQDWVTDDARSDHDKIFILTP